MSEGLKDYLERNPRISGVYFNEKDEWQFHKRQGYDRFLSRDEILPKIMIVKEVVNVQKAEVSPNNTIKPVKKMKPQKLNNQIIKK